MVQTLNLTTSYTLTPTGVTLSGTPTASTSPSVKGLVAGWNLVGNATQAINVSATFGDSSFFNSVWSWDAVKSQWNFFTPRLNSTDLQAYATSKGYGVLSQIAAGDGYWVQALKAANSMCASGS